jgi:hypothetical protein
MTSGRGRLEKFEEVEKVLSRKAAKILMKGALCDKDSSGNP